MYKHRYSVTCLIVALLCSSVGLGQTNRFVNPDKMWICRWSGTNSQLQAKSFPVKYYFYGDTLISGKECLKLQLEWNDEPVRCIAAFYEEEGKVYYYPSRNSTEPALMYDFTASVGDSLHLSSPGNVGWPDSTENPAIVGGEPGSYDFLVTSVSDTIINMYQLSVTTLENGVTPPVKIINGIGTLSGPLNLVGYSGYSVQLDSCRIGDKTIFSMSPAASKQPHDTLLFCGFEQGESNYVINNKAVRPDGSADEVRIVTEEFHVYDIYNEPDPNVVNYNYLEWKTGGNMNDSECKPGDASLTIGDFSLKAGLPYCLDYHIGSDVWGGNVLIGVFHRTAEGLVPVSGPMISPDGYLNNGMFFSPLFGYSSVMFYSNADYEDCCLRLSFVSPGRTFRLDNLTLSKNKMCNVLVDGDLARIEFAFPTNISDIAGAAPFGAVEVPSDYFSITGVSGQEPYVYDILGGEYHSDGRLYVWIEDDSFIGITNIRISFTNPAEETGLALKYIESISAETNDTVWRRVPDLVDLYAGDNSSSLSVSYMDYFKSCSLDRYIDGVPSDLDSIVVSFKKPLLEGSESRITARMENLDGNEEAWYADYYDKEYYSVVFRRHPSDKDKPLRGYCRFHVENVYYFEELSDHYTIPAYFGDRFDGVMLRVEPVHDSLASTITEHYSLDGRIIGADAPGLHIIRSVGGRVSKVLVK